MPVTKPKTESPEDYARRLRLNNYERVVLAIAALEQVASAMHVSTISHDVRRLCIEERDSLHRRAAELHDQILGKSK
jgi:hypothetical protein